MERKKDLSLANGPWLLHCPRDTEQGSSRRVRGDSGDFKADGVILKGCNCPEDTNVSTVHSGEVNPSVSETWQDRWRGLLGQGPTNRLCDSEAECEAAIPHVRISGTHMCLVQDGAVQGLEILFPRPSRSEANYMFVQ